MALEREYKTYPGETYYVASTSNVRQMLLGMNTFFRLYLDLPPASEKPSQQTLRPDRRRFPAGNRSAPFHSAPDEHRVLSRASQSWPVSAQESRRSRSWRSGVPNYRSKQN